MHEQSETIQTADGKWINVYGKRTARAGEPLPRRYKFEQDSYPTVKAATHAARKRSQAEGRRMLSGTPQDDRAE